GADAQSPSELRQLAPEEFRAITHRAVRPEDYAEAAERLPWVQKAGGVFRWTGSWLTAFVTPDPKGKTVIDALERKELTSHLNRFRQAGREVNIM
ncbi:MAG TPA: putative baseplate assembly protein, partial [Ignavibacteria bacterium]|nr:putative baseplate assembly protein [Ignavibacteria bacterium]